MVIKVKQDQLTGTVLIFLGIFAAAMINTFRMPFTAAYPGPKMLPAIAATGFIVCGVGIFISSTLSKKEEKPFMIKEGWVRMGIALIVLAVYVFAMTFVGYLMATPIMTYVLSTLFARGQKSTTKGRMLFSVLLTLIIYVIYVFAFGLGLPEGSLFY